MCAAHDKSECGCGATFLRYEDFLLRQRVEQLELALKQKDEYITMLEYRNQELLDMYVPTTGE